MLICAGKCQLIHDPLCKRASLNGVVLCILYIYCTNKPLFYNMQFLGVKEVANVGQNELGKLEDTMC